MNALCRIKICKTCQVPKELDDFPTYNSRHHGKPVVKPVCRECIKIRDNQYKINRRKNDPAYRQRELDRNKSYRDKYGDNYRLCMVKKREKQKLEYFTSLEKRLKHMCSASKRRAEKRGMEFEITHSILYVMAHCQEMKCSVTGIPFDLNSHADYHKNPYGISIDRKDPNKGYIVSNIQLVCTWYNMMKNEWSDADAKKLIKIAYETLFKGEI